MQPVDLLFSGGIICTMDAERRIISDGAVAIAGERIVAVGPSTAVLPTVLPSYWLSARGKLVLPGFINTHTHAPLTVLRGVAEDKGSFTTLYGIMYPLKRLMTPEAIYHLGLLGLLEILKSGATTTVEMYDQVACMAPAVEQLGMRAVLVESCYDVDVTEIKDRGYHFRTDLMDITYNRAAALIEDWQGKAGGRITAGIGPHASDTCSLDLHRRLQDLAAKHQLVMGMHVAQTPVEVERIHDYYNGLGVVEFLHQHGLLNNRLLCAHCTFLKDNEMDLLASAGAHQAHLAQCNARFAKIAPAVHLQMRGVNVTLGTDNMSGNMLECWRYAQTGARYLTKDGTKWPALELLELATINGAKAIDRADDLGSLEVGKLADLVLIDLQKPHLYPLIDPVASAVNMAETGDIDTVVVGGQIVVSEGKATRVDEGEIMAEAQRVANKIWTEIRHQRMIQH